MFLFLLILFVLLIIIIVIWNYRVTKNSNWTFLSERSWLSRRNQYKKKSNTKCCVISGDNRTSSDITLLKNINQKYCDRNNYTFLFFDQLKLEKYEKDYPPYWWKVKMVYDTMLKSNYEYVMWLDSDACFHDHSIRIESLPWKNKIFIMAGDNEIFKISNNLNFTGEFNAGVWIVRNNHKGRCFMRDWLSFYHDRQKDQRWYRRGKEWVCRYYFLPCMWAGTYYEQGSCYELMHNSKYAPYILQLHYDILQGYKRPNKASYTIHFCGDTKKYIKEYATHN